MTDAGRYISVGLEEDDGTDVGAYAFPVAATLGLLLFPLMTGAWWDVVFALALGGLAAGSAFGVTRDAGTACLAGPAAMVLAVGSAAAIAGALVLATLVATRLTGTPWPALVLVAAGMMPAFGSWLGALGIAFLAAGFVGSDSTRREWHLPLAAAAGAAAVLVVMNRGDLVPLVGLATGLAARFLVLHPGHDGVAAMLGKGGAWFSVLPACVLFLVSALGRGPEQTGTLLLMVAWSTVGIGALVAAAGLGYELILRSTEPARALDVGLPLAGAAILVGVAAAGDLDAAWLVAAATWPGMALAIALGARRFMAYRGGWTLWVGAAYAVAVGVAAFARILA